MRCMQGHPCSTVQVHVGKIDRNLDGDYLSRSRNRSRSCISIDSRMKRDLVGPSVGLGLDIQGRKGVFVCYGYSDPVWGMGCHSR
jgi:hypothetical protein